MNSTSDSTATLMPPPRLLPPEEASSKEAVAPTAPPSSSAPEDRHPPNKRRATEPSAGAPLKWHQRRPAPQQSGAEHVEPSVPVKIAGERFMMEFRPNGVCIRHPRWSLLGEGASILDAELSLLEEAADLAPVYVEAPPASLDHEALRLRDFILRIVS